METIALTRSFGHVKVHLFTEFDSLGITCGICPSSPILYKSSSQEFLPAWEKAKGYGPEKGIVLWFCPGCLQIFKGWHNITASLQYPLGSLEMWVAIWLGLQLGDVSIDIKPNP